MFMYCTYCKFILCYLDCFYFAQWQRKQLITFFVDTYKSVHVTGVDSEKFDRRRQNLNFEYFNIWFNWTLNSLSYGLDRIAGLITCKQRVLYRVIRLELRIAISCHFTTYLWHSVVHLITFKLSRPKRSVIISFFKQKELSLKTAPTTCIGRTNRIKLVGILQ